MYGGCHTSYYEYISLYLCFAKLGKVNLNPSLINHESIEAHEGVRVSDPHIFITCYMGGDQLRVLATALLKKQPLGLTAQAAGRTPESAWPLWRREKSFATEKN